MGRTDGGLFGRGKELVPRMQLSHIFSYSCSLPILVPSSGNGTGNEEEGEGRKEGREGGREEGCARRSTAHLRAAILGEIRMLGRSMLGE